MKKISFSLLLLLSFTFCKAQFVTIYDTTFASWLRTNAEISGCIIGNQLDTTCYAVKTKTTLNCSGANISSIRGIEYFRNLDTLICSNNKLTALGTLPPKLVYLDFSINNWYGWGLVDPLPSTLLYLSCYGNTMSGFSYALPPNLKYLIISENQLGGLPTLPSSLVYLNCASDGIGSLQGLPSGLRYLNCSYNYNSGYIVLGQLPALPPTLDTLICGTLDINHLPTLPSTLKYLDCSSDSLDSLPALPTGLLYLNCSGSTYPPSKITHLPALPSSLQYLDCSVNKIAVLPALPASLQYLNCSDDGIVTLPALPGLLQQFICSGNKLAGLPALPSSITYLDCSSNASLTGLPALPSSLTILNCYSEPLTSLPALPNKLKDLNCSFDDITSLPPLPQTMDGINVLGNFNLTCLPPIQALTSSFSPLNITDTKITCLPNRILHPNISAAVYPMDTMRLCGIFNPTGCAVAWNISGTVFADTTGNCDTTVTEQGLGQIKVKLYDATGINLLQQVITTTSGTYSFKTGVGHYIVKVDTAGIPFNVICPGSDAHTSVLAGKDTLDYYANFRLACKSGYDLGINAVNYVYGAFTPANIASIAISAGDLATYYGVNCNTGGLAGTVQAIFTGPVTYSGSTGTMLPASVKGDTITWNVNDFSLVDFTKSFAFALHTDTNAYALDEVCIAVTINGNTGADYNTSNNTLTQCFSVTTSHDPNFKEVYPSNSANPGDWLTYTIHFQNTGTASAQNIYVLDTIDNNLDIASIQIISESNTSIIQVLPGRIVRFNFPNIELPDSLANNTGSIGYVQFKIRTNLTIPTNTTITNTASVYFDYNSPVQTNTAITQFDFSTAANQLKISNGQYTIYPNPASTSITIAGNNISPNTIYTITDITGREITSGTLNNPTNHITIDKLTAGIYLLQVGNAQRQTFKVVKQ